MGDNGAGEGPGHDQVVGRRRENMVGVDMALAELVRFKHGLYKSCGIECVEGIMLEPCLLQPCLHVAGLSGSVPKTSGRQDRLWQSPLALPLKHSMAQVKYK